MPKLVAALKFPRIGLTIRQDKEVTSQLSVQDYREAMFTDRTRSDNHGSANTHNSNPATQLPDPHPRT